MRSPCTRHRALSAALLASPSLLSLTSAPPTRAGDWKRTLSGPMTTSDNSAQGTKTWNDEYDADLATATIIETTSEPATYSSSFPFLLPLIDQANPSTLTGTGFDTTEYTYGTPTTCSAPGATAATRTVPPPQKSPSPGCPPPART